MLGQIYGYKGVIIIIRYVCVLRPPIKLSGLVEETVLVDGSVRADCVHFFVYCMCTLIL